jgi:ESCRT-I complex subunit VPS28
MVAASSDRSSAQESLATAKMDFQRPLSYAPTPYSYTPNPALSSSINLDEVSPRSLISDPTNPGKEVKLASSSTERDLYESLAEIYSIIITLDGLEKAYIRDAIPEAEYTETCARLLKQYKSTLGDDTVAREFVDLETFKRTWDVCYVPCQVIVTERRLI